MTERYFIAKEFDQLLNVKDIINDVMLYAKAKAVLDTKARFAQASEIAVAPSLAPANLKARLKKQKGTFYAVGAMIGLNKGEINTIVADLDLLMNQPEKLLTAADEIGKFREQLNSKLVYLRNQSVKG